MAVFIELTTEAFAEVFRTHAAGTQGGESGRRSTRAGASSARRPLRGIEIKEDTYAMMKVIRADGREIPLIDSSSPDGTSHSYTNFILQSVSEARAEKNQIVQTFGDNYIFFFGEDPRFLDCQAVLINSHDFNWRAEWWANYNTYLRGTKLAELGARLYLFYDDIVVEGYLMACQASETQGSPYTVQMQFKMFVTNYQNVSFVGDPDFPVRSSVLLPDGVDLTKGSAGKNLIASYRGAALDAVKSQNASQATQSAADSGALATEGVSSTSTTLGPFEAAAYAANYPGGSVAGAGFGLPQQTPANPLASGRRITKILQSVPISFAVSQDWWDFMLNRQDLQGALGLKNIIARSGNPIRGKIADNYDEYTGAAQDTAYQDLLAQFGFDVDPDHVPMGMAGTIQKQFEVDDLFREAIEFLGCFGANINDPGLMLSLGLGPNFKPQVNVSDGATFNATGESTPLDEFLSKTADRIDSTTEGISNAFDSFAQDPLGSVFGKSGGSEFGANRSKYTEGAGDPLYGYPSDFASGPGFGQAGFGDLGGVGFGTALGEHGDPGFKDPNKFTFAGVAESQGAYDRFIAPKEDPTALSITAGGSLGLGTSGLTGAAGVLVGGTPSAFAVVSVPGLLDETGQARQQAQAIADKQARQKFGFSLDNPYGVNCPQQSGSFSEGFTHSWP